MNSKGAAACTNALHVCLQHGDTHFPHIVSRRGRAPSSFLAVMQSLQSRRGTASISLARIICWRAKWAQLTFTEGSPAVRRSLSISSSAVSFDWSGSSFEEGSEDADLLPSLVPKRDLSSLEPDERWRRPRKDVSSATLRPAACIAASGDYGGSVSSPFCCY